MYSTQPIHSSINSFQSYQETTNTDIIDQARDNAKTLDALEKKVNALYDLIVLQQPKQEIIVPTVCDNKPLIYSPKHPLARLIDEGILAHDIDKMREMLKNSNIDLNQKYLVDPSSQETPIQAVLSVLQDDMDEVIEDGKGLTEKLAFEMIDLLLENGARLDEETLVDSVYPSDENTHRHAIWDYLSSKQEYFIAQLSPKSLENRFAWGYDLVGLLKYLVKIGVPFSKAAGIFPDDPFHYSSGAEIIEALKILKDNHYDLSERYTSQYLGRRVTLLTDLAHKQTESMTEPKFSEQEFAEMMRLVIPIFESEIRYMLRIQGLNSFENFLASAEDRSGFDNKICYLMQDIEFYVREMKVIAPYLSECYPKLFSKKA